MHANPHLRVRMSWWESRGGRMAASVSFCRSNCVSQPHRENIMEKKVILLLSVDCPLDWKGILSSHPPLLAVSPTPTNHWTVWDHDFLLVCVIGSSQCVPSPMWDGSRPKAVCLDMWVHCRLWASTNLTGRFLLTFPHGYVHIWVEFISPLLFVTATFTYNPQPLSSGAAGEADIILVVAPCLLFLTVTEKLDKKTKKYILWKENRLVCTDISQANSDLCESLNKL